LQLSGTGPVVGTYTATGPGFGEILAIGGTIPHGFVIAGAASFVVANDGVNGNYGLLFDWFPDDTAGWHIGGLLGLGLVRSPLLPLPVAGGGTVIVQTGQDLQGFGLGATLLGGYDVWITPQFSVGLDLIASTTTTAPMKDPGGNESGYRITPLWVGLLASVLYH
jgi:hypothetical protein